MLQRTRQRRAPLSIVVTRTFDNYQTVFNPALSPQGGVIFSGKNDNKKSPKSEKIPSFVEVSLFYTAVTTIRTNPNKIAPKNKQVKPNLIIAFPTLPIFCALTLKRSSFS